MCARFREVVPLVLMWCGLPIGAHAPERKPISGVVEIDRGIQDQMSSKLGSDIIVPIVIHQND